MRLTRPGVLGDVGEQFRDGEVLGGLDRLRKASPQRAGDLELQRDAPAQARTASTRPRSTSTCGFDVWSSWSRVALPTAQRGLTVRSMSNRLKRTLVSAVGGVATVFGLTALWMSQGASPAGVVPWAVGFAVIFAVITWYTWWFYGDSSKALALQAKAEAKKSQRLEQPMPDGSEYLVAAAARKDLQLPRFLRPLLPHMRLKGWLMPLVFALLALGFWGLSISHQDRKPMTHAFEAFCFAVVSVFFVIAKGWVEWRVRRNPVEK